MNRPVIVLGGGGHATVLVEILLEQEYHVLGYTAPFNQDHGDLADGVHWIGPDEVIQKYAPVTVWLVNGIGSIGAPQTRLKVYEEMTQLGYQFMNVVHSNATVSPSVKLGSGVQIMAGAVVQAGTILGDNVIVNTRASIDHHCKVGPHVHIAPGVTICGGVHIDERTHIGAGATLVQGLTVGRNSVVGAGSVIVKDVEDDSVVLGIPGRRVNT